MKIDYRHNTEGAGRVIVNCPFPVVIVVDAATTHRSADVTFISRWTAWTGPAGLRGDALGVEIDVPGSVTSLKNKMRPGTYMSGDDISKDDPTLTSEVRIRVPLGCTFEIGHPGRISVVHDGARMSVRQAQVDGLLSVK